MMAKDRSTYKFYFDWTDDSSGIFLAVKNIILSRKTQYQFVELMELGNMGLCLVIDGKIQIAEADEFVYHEVLVHLPMIAFGEPKSVLVIGGGDGCAIREIFKYESVRRCVLVDIDKDVVEISKEYLGRINRSSFFDPRLEVVIEDGRKYIERTDELFDVIIIDTVDPIEYGPSYMLFSKEFMETVGRRLTGGGIVAVQSNVLNPINSRFLVAMYKTLEKCFPRVSCASVYVSSFMLNWAFTFGSKGRVPDDVGYEEICQKLSRVETRFLTPEMFRAVLARPKYLEEKLKSSDEIITDDKPVFVF